MNRNSESNHLRDAFGALNERELKELKRNSPWLTNNQYFDANEMNQLAEEIGEKTGRRIQLAEINVVKNTFLDHVNIPTLYTEVTQRIQNQPKLPLIHQGGEYNRLYRWQKFIDITEPFLRPVQYSVVTKKRPTNRSVFSTIHPLTLSNRELHVAVQDRLIESHYNGMSLLLPELVEPLERILDATLTRVIIMKDLVFMFYEWVDAMPFVFMMAFQLLYREDSGEAFARHTIVTLYKDDVINLDDAEEGGQQPKPTVTTCTDNEEEDLLSMKYMSTERYEDERILLPFIRCVKTSCISYMTSGYIKRD